MKINILITGASSGLGEELARRFDNENNTLFLIARRKDRLKELKATLKAKVKIYDVDVADFEKLMKTTSKIAAKYPLDIVIANAGMSLGHEGFWEDFEGFKKLNEVNYLSIHALLTPIVPHMIERKSGKIVLISSMASYVAMPTSVAYSASKRAVSAYAEGLRNRLSPFGIKVLNIKPGFIQSEMTDKNHFKMPFLLSTSDGVNRIYNAIVMDKYEYAFPFRFFLIVKTLSFMPRVIKDRLIRYLGFSK